MNIKIIQKNSANIAVISSNEIIINNAQDALDLMATVRYEYICDKMIINKQNINEEFFDLKNGLAGAIMQKYTNYGMALAIVGDFEKYDSKSLKSLIYESNKGSQIIFKSTETEAIESL